MLRIYHVHQNMNHSNDWSDMSQSCFNVLLAGNSMMRMGLRFETD